MHFYLEVILWSDLGALSFFVNEDISLLDTLHEVAANWA